MHPSVGRTSGSFKQSWALLLGDGPVGICVCTVTHLLELGFPRLDRPYLYFFLIICIFKTFTFIYFFSFFLHLYFHTNFL